MIPPHINRFLDSDILGYWPQEQKPRYWIHIKRGRKPWVKKLSNIRGLHIRLRYFGFCFHFGPGIYINPRAINLGSFKAVFYKVSQFDEWLESWCGY